MLTFSARIFNHTNADVTNATVILRDAIARDHPYASIFGVNLAAGGDTKVSQSVSIPQREYEQWLRGAPPHLVIQLSSGEERPVEISRGPIGGN